MVSPDDAALTASWTESKSQPLAHTSQGVQVPLTQMLPLSHWLLVVHVALQMLSVQKGLAGSVHCPSLQHSPSRQAPLQQISPWPVSRHCWLSPHEPHEPLLQNDAVIWHSWPHEPQLSGSFLTSMQAPLQNACPAGQVQAPPWQVRPPLQTWQAAPFLPHA